MKTLFLVATSLLLPTLSVSAMQAEDLPAAIRVNIPPPILRATAAFAAASQYRLSASLNPFYLSGDFDGDHIADYAVLIQQARGAKTGIAIVHGGTNSISIIAAGHDFGNGGDSFDWMDAWAVQAGGAGKPDRLLVMKTESASATIEWTGKAWRWRQAGD